MKHTGSPNGSSEPRPLSLQLEPAEPLTADTEPLLEADETRDDGANCVLISSEAWIAVCKAPQVSEFVLLY
jgi:hypothetical protein